MLSWSFRGRITILGWFWWCAPDSVSCSCVLHANIWCGCSCVVWVLKTIEKSLHQGLSPAPPVGTGWLKEMFHKHFLLKSVLGVQFYFPICVLASEFRACFIYTLYWYALRIQGGLKNAKSTCKDTLSPPPAICSAAKTKLCVCTAFCIFDPFQILNGYH